MWKNRRRLHLWRDTLTQNRVSEVDGSGRWIWRASLAGRAGEVEVRITDARGQGDHIVVVLEGPAGFSLLRLRRQTVKLWTQEVEVGDEAFDDAFLVEGPVRPVSALLDATLRSQLLRASAACTAFEIGGGRLQVGLPETALAVVLPELLKIGRQLSEPLDAANVERLIVHNALHDPKAGVRLANLLLLIHERPGDPDTLETLRSASSDRSPKVRVRAAIALGDEGRDILLKLLEKPRDDALCAQAVSHLDGTLPFEEARDLLERSLRRSLPETARACMEVLGRRGAVAVGVLAGVMKKEKAELAAAAARALGTAGETAAETPLLLALQSEDGDLREAAAAALGQIGTAAAVQPLKEAAERSWLHLALRKAARQAIAEIQSRLEGASPGQLSLAGAEAGQLSLARADAGRLSLTPEREEPAGRPV